MSMEQIITVHQNEIKETVTPEIRSGKRMLNIEIQGNQKIHTEIDCTWNIGTFKEKLS
jgi:uncharacterized protein YjaG (DUF416 family)